jgi:membrane protein YqaA with SNARE-associated domain
MPVVYRNRVNGERYRVKEIFVDVILKMNAHMRKIPILPLSALIFYIAAIILWKLNIIPSPNEILQILKSYYDAYGYFGLVLAAFLESIVYLGLYFPGSFIIALAVFFSDGTFNTLLTISILVAATLTFTAIINYFLGRIVAKRNFFEKDEFIRESKTFSKGLVLSMLHPNLLAFYFFNAGLENHSFKKIAFVPVFMIPYGYVIALGLYKLSEPAKDQLENPYILLAFVLLWVAVAFVREYRKTKIKRV